MLPFYVNTAYQSNLCTVWCYYKSTSKRHSVLGSRSNDGRWFFAV